MSELKEREQLKSKAIEDTDFLKSKATEIRTILRSYFSDIQAFAPIDAALNTVTMNGTDYLDTGSMESLRNFYANFLNRFTIAARAFLHNQSNKNTQNELIESAKAFNEIIKSTTNEKKDTDIKTGGGVFVEGVDISHLAKRIKILEEEQKPLNEIIIRNEQNDTKYLTQIDEIKKNITDLQSSNSQIEINKMLMQTKALFDEATNSKQLISDEVTELKRAKEGHIAYELSKQFSEKCEALKKQKRLHFWMMDIFMFFILLSNSTLWILPIQELFSIKDIELWQHFLVAFSLNLPLIVIVSFHLNEYTKLNKLYEEYENKRIMAATFVNNLKNLKSELQTDEKDLLELIKTPFEKIFDNPVHSIYGDKSGDKNIGLDQLEKFASVFEKIKR